MYPYYRPLPPVNPDQFASSAKEMEQVLKEGRTITKKVEDSTSFASSLMTAAQQSNYEEVKRLIKTLAVSSKVDVTFTPDSLKVKLNRQDSKLTLTYRW
ncbi:hypothetical protein [Halobacillus salinus]|uniref:Uncharacterized protein n=1 Tax=Halobacillus salinus TaxID=192814 RepID=A0A4Z0H384_9BACI|nr:hypothetical protein [Halobacillus salinus]TGB04848.1 hypothetical protein E4663_07600 [Halobacillus salinus]